MFYIFNRATGTLVTKTWSPEILKCYPANKFEVISYSWNTKHEQ